MGMPFCTGTPYLSNICFAWYSCIFILLSEKVNN